MSKTKSIAFVSDAIFPYNKGGKETRLYEISSRLVKKGWDVHIYCMKWWKGPSDKIENGVHLHGISPNYSLYSGSRRSMKQGILFGLACFKLISADFDLVDVDHMPFFPLYSMRAVCWIKNKKMFATWHEVWGMKYWREYLGFVKGTIAGLIELISVQFPNLIIAVSEMTADRLKNILHYNGELSVAHNGLDLHTISKAKRSEVKSDVMFAGRLLTHKNVDILIQSIEVLKKSFPDVKLIVVGEGPEKKNLIQLVAKLKLKRHVTFLPFQPKATDLYGLMKATKVFVLPSSREGFGLSVLEANAAGKPVVTINHPDNAAQYNVQKNAGSVVKLSSNEIAIAVQKYLKNNRKIIFTKGQYDWDKIVDQLSKVYEASLYAS